MSLIVKLNGSNYLSEKRRATIEEVLHQPAPVVRRGNGSNGNGHHGEKGGNGHHTETLPTAAPKAAAIPTAPAPLPLERALDHLFAHQEATLRVHESYLRNQGEYARLFSNLLEQQGRIFAEGNGDPHRTEAAVKVIGELSRSMARFHQIQEEALHLHQSFLAQQAEHGRLYLQLLQMRGGFVDAVHPASASFSPSSTPHPPVEAPADDGWEEAPEWDAEPSAVIAPPAPSAEVAPSVEPQVAPVEPPPASEGLKSALLEIVAEKTGYPPEMLDLTMDMEADLGIDSIKRVEILAALQERFPHLPEIEADELAELRTLEEILAHVGQSAVASPKA